MNKKKKSNAILHLRSTIAVNHFKRLILGDLHVPGKAQAAAVYSAIEEAFGEDELTDRTWQNRFSTPMREPKVGKVKVLDTVAASVIRNVPGEVAQPLPSNTFSELVHGGLVRCLLAPTKASKKLPTLVVRAMNYQPLSPLHLHLDAIEISALVNGYDEVPWEVVKAIGSQRILELLAERWSPRRGQVYAELSSEMSLRWNDATSEERTKIRNRYAKLKPSGYFSQILNDDARPDWRRTGVKTDVAPVHIYKTLFALAADAQFMVADRLTAWSLDLATAAFAMHALAWTDRFTTFGHRVTDEMIFWAAFYHLLFDTESPEFDDAALPSAMSQCDAEWDSNAFDTLLRARQTYAAELIELGVSVTDVFSVAMQGSSAHPLIYEPN